MKKIVFISVVLLATAQNAGAWTFYQQNKSPSYLQNQAVTTYQQQLYDSSKNNLHPYSTFQSPYDNSSVRNNFDQYAQHIYSHQGQFQGLASQQPVGVTNSVTNPYGPHGNNFSSQSPVVPFDQQRSANPYSTAQDPYHSESFRNSNQYGVQYKDSAGQTVGNKNMNSTNETSVTGGFQQSPYDENSVQNPYGGNKITN